MCMRYAEYCDPLAPCFPGDPMPEMCNGLDDDCDGVVDQGELCSDDLVCHQAFCKTLDEALAIDPNFVPFQGSDPVPSGGSGGATGGMSGTPAGGNGGSTSLTAGSGGSTPVGIAGSATGSGGTSANPQGPEAAAASGCGVAGRLANFHWGWLSALSLLGLAVHARRSLRRVFLA